MQIDFEHGVAAGIAAIIGGVLTKIVSLHLKKMELDFSESSRLRTDITKRCENLENEVRTYRKESEYWHDRHTNDTNVLKVQVENMKIELQSYHVQLRDIKSRRWIPDSEKDRYE